MKNKKFYFFIGTTAELIKLAPIIREFEKRLIGFKIIASNQNVLHFEEVATVINKKSSDYTFITKPFKYSQDIYLRFIVWFIRSLGNYFLYFRNQFIGSNKKNIFLIVHGDTVTSFIGSLIAKLGGVQLVHVESGLRSFSFFEPCPEELCRFVASRLADIHFCPNAWAKNNLADYNGTKINTFYNTVGESVSLALKSLNKINFFKSRTQKYFILVIHRQEHTLFSKRNTEKIINLFIKEANDNLKCIFIMHDLTKDYLVKQKLIKKIRNNPNVILPSRLPYPSFIKLVKNCEFMATDGGTNQEEAYFLGKPCLILRNRTERIEGLRKNALLSHNKEGVIKDFIKSYRKYKTRKINIRIYPSKIIVDYLINN